MKRNLRQLCERSAAKGASVILAGMEAPPNLGPEYTAQFRAAYSDLASELKVPLLPFLLQGVAGDAALNQDDGIHPNEAGAARVAELIWPVLAPVVAQRIAR
jgi:acyl-CoA thioesterase-1